MILTEEVKKLTNYGKLKGKIVGEINVLQSPHGAIYGLALAMERNSGVLDTIPVTIPERLVTGYGKELKEGDNILVSGEYRSYNKVSPDEPGKSKLILHFFANTLEESSDKSSLNEINLLGYICKPPVYRTTPFNRQICDVLLAVNRSYHKSDYLPCILWGRNANMVSDLPVGTPLEFAGRIQSREYTKKLNGQEEKRTAYEVSVGSVKILDKDALKNRDYIESVATEQE